MSDSQHAYYCKSCDAEYLASTPEPGKYNPCPQCGTPMVLKSEVEEDEPILTGLLTTIVDEIIAETESMTGAVGHASPLSRGEKVEYAQMLALTKIAFELERIGGNGQG